MLRYSVVRPAVGQADLTAVGLDCWQEDRYHCQTRQPQLQRMKAPPAPQAERAQRRQERGDAREDQPDMCDEQVSR